VFTDVRYCVEIGRLSKFKITRFSSHSLSGDSSRVGPSGYSEFSQVFRIWLGSMPWNNGEGYIHVGIFHPLYGDDNGDVLFTGNLQDDREVLLYQFLLLLPPEN
jgi:hypothetical protein